MVLQAGPPGERGRFGSESGTRLTESPRHIDVGPGQSSHPSARCWTVSDGCDNACLRPL
jgi:hypothetical protein